MVLIYWRPWLLLSWMLTFSWFSFWMSKDPWDRFIADRECSCPVWWSSSISKISTTDEGQSSYKSSLIFTHIVYRCVMLSCPYFQEGLCVCKRDGLPANHHWYSLTYCIGVWCCHVVLSRSSGRVFSVMVCVCVCLCRERENNFSLVFVCVCLCVSLCLFVLRCVTKREKLSVCVCGWCVWVCVCVREPVWSCLELLQTETVLVLFHDILLLNYDWLCTKD